MNCRRVHAMMLSSLLVFAALAVQAQVRITELMYNPAPPPGGTSTEAQDYEFVELRNVSASATVSLSGVKFTTGITFDFTSGAVPSLAPGARVVIVKNLTAFTARYGSGLPVAGVYSGSLNNGGERLQLVDSLGADILNFTYSNGWFPITDGLGFSLVVVDEAAAPANWGQKSQWRASGVRQGTPGTADPGLPTTPRIRVSEVLAHSDPPYSDSIELFNPTASTVNIGGWLLTDAFFTPAKYRIPDGVTIAPGGYAWFSSLQFGAAFGLSEYGEEVCLFAADAQTNLTGYYDQFTFGASPTDVSLIRWTNSVGKEDIVLAAAVTLGTTNSLPRVGPVVISEIMYHPPDVGGVDNALGEFIELQNITASDYPLYEPIALTNTCRLRNAVDFDFPQGQMVPPGGRLLVVSFDPSDTAQLAAFRATYSVPASVPVYGPWTGKLLNSAATLELKIPGVADVVGADIIVPYMTWETVTYSDTAPWPTNADGLGLSLHRATLGVYANEPTNWFGALPTAGAAAPLPDADGDTLPDAWEKANGTDPFLADSGLDPDLDGLTNLQEYTAGTSPTNAASVLRLDVRRGPARPEVLLSFTAMSNKTYTVQARTSTVAGAWSKLADIGSASANRTVTVTNSATNSSSRTYRLVTPLQ